METGGLHIMLLDLKQPLTAGEALPLTLTFREGRESGGQRAGAGDPRRPFPLSRIGWHSCLPCREAPSEMRRDASRHRIAVGDRER